MCALGTHEVIAFVTDIQFSKWAGHMSLQFANFYCLWRHRLYIPYLEKKKEQLADVYGGL